MREATRRWAENEAAAPSHLRVTESDGLFEIVDALLTTRSPAAQETEIVAKLILTREDAEWLRRTLTEMLMPVSALEVPHARREPADHECG